MAGILDSVNQRTQLVGQNRLELLLFKLNGRQRFGINVFKVREVLQCPPLTSMPKSNTYIRGVAHIRGQTISVIDLSMAVGGRPIKSIEDGFIIIAEYNRTVQGFLVGGVERIVNMNWEKIMPPPSGAGRYSYLTAVTEIENELVEILDVEKILNEICPVNTTVSDDVASQGNIQKDLGERIVFIADDSAVARNQVKRALEPLGVTTELAKNGKEALIRLKEIAELDCVNDITERVGLLISDVEMPEMDGYTLTAEIKANPKLAPLHVILHTSLSGVFNQAMIEKVGADDFIAKFNPDELATAVNKWVHRD
ncbi:MAG: two-component system chemotaxis response regulator CheV [Pseudoalteromonas tetraodonis]|jgi:two-component system chemotaxis response regulator CheV|uniref:Chemotaxis protein CheW n=4 Tax=Pseudoalteromonas TaxID=53246 RepID=A0AA37S1C2_9GAMM|nr:MULTISPECIES: chemotaxis protein [Pseudoalteromonas]PHQ91087.1 MAG: chemotaxis protein CheV [Pseudoalteromonas sp.]ADT69210.1 chemotaxis protein [Pseudoalteromonas sp. SM9913]ALQ55514.1 Chemotaxis protein [Pseudoalteromonas issachenkonii]ATC91367.1 two-component system, chemotaxis family, response regulator CheV [Pseudoalteromonas issachenkonii]ATD03909.1 two-component system, chemotaxis family, response regulator CheV [Pseudoalteromonas tetraodonis]|tara:strand:- start:40 stop:972 length:933 start_codon:yes stop_codon:yes gene_type:complete